MIRRKICFVVSISAFFLLAAPALFFMIIALTAYRPESVTVLTSLPQAAPLKKDTIEILTWNIGYAGLDSEMDFFYDGGKKSRTNKAKTTENLDSITHFLAAVSADFVFLQEVDKNSRRSYHIDQISAISQNMPLYTSIYATNYKSLFVPAPPHSPTGSVESGLTILCQHIPQQSLRYAYPSRQSGLKQMFMPNRCFILCRLALKNGKNLVLINTHNSAFDHNGEQRNVEMRFLKDFILNEYLSGNYVIVGGDWNQTPPLENAVKYQNINTEYFIPLAISPNLMPREWKFVSDGNATNRFLDMPYIKGLTKETLIDFFLVSPNVEAIATQRINLKYRHSDHNPVFARFVLKQP